MSCIIIVSHNHWDENGTEHNSENNQSKEGWPLMATEVDGKVGETYSQVDTLSLHKTKAVKKLSGQWMGI